MGWSHTQVQWKVAVMFLELWPPFPAHLVLASVLLKLEHAQEQMMWELSVAQIQHVMVSIVIVELHNYKLFLSDHLPCSS